MNFLKNVWYCAGFSSELEGEPIGRTFLNEEVVLYRGLSSGEAFALSGRCPHRFAPMSMGTVIDDTLMCGYHGLRFDASGGCTYNPHGDIIPPQTTLKRYPLAEKAGVLWIWMGDPALADDSDLPESNFFTDSAYKAFTFYMKVQSNYELVTDNLLDLTHAPYVHAGSLANAVDTDIVIAHDFSVDGNVISSKYHIPVESPSVWFEKLIDEDKGETSTTMTWYPASRLELDHSMIPLDAGEDARVNTPSLHYLTPETEVTTHYFNAQGRNKKIDDDSVTEHAKKLINKGFLAEDAPMIEACQEYVGVANLLSLRPSILTTDTPAVMARRILSKMIKEENTLLSR